MKPLKTYLAVLFLVDQLNVITNTMDESKSTTKKCFKNGKTENDLDALNIISSECTKLLLVSNKKNMFDT